MKNPVLLILAALVALTVSCTEFETVELGVCGNRVLEAGEDCDGAAILEGGTCAEPDTENACFYTCDDTCLLYTSPSPRDATLSRMPSSA